MRLEACDLHYQRGEAYILRGVDLRVGAGEVASIVGPNGAGKSTLLKCLNHIVKPSRGEVIVDGRPIDRYSRRDLARVVAYVPQQSPSVHALTVAEMVMLGRAPHRGFATARRDREVVLDMIARLRLEGLALRRFGSLSGGERQRVLLARALAQDSRLLLLDEPTSALDLRHQLETMTIVREAVQARGLSAVVAIHDLALASRFSDRLVLLAQGMVRATGPWRDVLMDANMAAAYGVDVIVGTDSGLPYVIPAAVPDSPGNGGPG